MKKHMHKDSAAIERMFSAIAPWYDFLNHFLSFNVDRRWRRRAAELAGLGDTDRVLDVCCGTADMALAFERRRPAMIVGTDFCWPMLKFGQGKVRRNGSAVQFAKADSLALPFRSDSFDTVAVAFGIRNVADLGSAIREMTRVARPGGKVLILEFSMPKNMFFRSTYYFYFTKVLPFFGNKLSKSGEKAYTYLPDSVLAFPDADGLRGEMERAGLEDVAVHPLTGGVATVHLGRKKRNTLTKENRPSPPAPLPHVRERGSG